MDVKTTQVPREATRICAGLGELGMDPQQAEAKSSHVLQSNKGGCTKNMLCLCLRRLQIGRAAANEKRVKWPSKALVGSIII